jgi:hypothetical protein
MSPRHKIKHHFIYDKKPPRLTAKELRRKTEDGICIAVRIQPEGGYGIFAVCVKEPDAPRLVGINWFTVSTKAAIRTAITELNRNLDKFCGRGGRMTNESRGSRSGRKATIKRNAEMHEHVSTKREQASALRV